MKKTLLACALASCAIAPAFADETPAATPDYTFTGNAGLFSDYRFRGFSQTNLGPAFQGGFDFAHKSGFYLGNWNSNVSESVYSGGNLEMDFYGGYKFSWSDLNFDVGGLYYYYPGSRLVKPNGDTKTVDNFELYGSVGYGPFSLKFSHGLTDFFGAPNSKSNYYIDGSAVFDLGDGWGVNGHIGYQKLDNDAAGLSHYWDYRIGATKDIGTWLNGLDGWIAGVSLVTTSQTDWYRTNKNRPAGQFGAVVSLTKAF